ncbi:MAG: HAD domain-containing protein [Planctomycetota bacterium]
MKATTIIYLDFDGVLLPLGGPALDADGRPVRAGNSIPALNRLTSSLPCELVVTSTWRLDRSLETLREMLRGWGAETRVSDVTPRLGDRLEEIRAHAAGRPECRIVVLDDEVFEAPDHWFVTRPAAHRGLTEADVDDLLRRLG